jgi:L-alanine-DL-glutamate epimerase-like enolase superfamily enzyme
MSAMQWLSSLRPALPMSSEQPCSPMSNGELRRLMRQGGVLVNGERIAPEEVIDFPVFSLVFFPASRARRTTIF